MEKQRFVHKHEQGAVNVPVLEHEIRFCNENVRDGQGWWFQTSPFINRKQRRRLKYVPMKDIPNQRKLSRGRLIFRLTKMGIAFATRMIDKLTQGPARPTLLSRVIQKALKRPQAAF